MAYHAETILRNLNQFRNEDDRFCDVEVLVNEVKFKAHRDVLRASSPYFADLFKSCENTQKTIELYSLDPNVFKCVLDFIYSGDLNMELNSLRDLLVVGQTLEMPEIIEKCSSALCDEINVSNVIETFNFATTNQMDRLQERTVEFIGSAFSSISGQRELLDMSKDMFVMILSAKLCVEDESQVFEAVLSWLNHDIEHRIQFVFEVFWCVSLTNVPMQIIDRSIEHCLDSSLERALSLLKNNLTIERVSSKKISTSLTIERVSSNKISTSLTIERVSNKKNVYVCYGKGIMKYDIELNKWQEEVVVGDYIQNNNFYPKVSIIGEQVYIFYTNDGEGSVLNLQDNKWRGKKMECPLFDFGLCEFGGKLWAFGGHEYGKMTSINCYDPLTNVWTEIDKMNINISYLRAVSFEGLIYLVGGYDEFDDYLTKFISYNPATKEWKYLGSYQADRSSFTVAILDRYLYIVGGRSCGEHLNTVERYSFDQNKWEYVSSMTEKRDAPAVCVANCLLFVFGGYDDDMSPYLSSAESYDPATNKWSKCKSAPRTICGPAFFK